MSLDVAGLNSEIPVTNDDDSATNKNPFDSLDTEHIYIGDEYADQAGKPTTIRRREYLCNHIHRTITEITFFQEGFLKIREGTKKILAKEHIVELRFLDPNPVTEQRIAMPWLWSSLGAAAAALLSSAILPNTDLSIHAAPVISILVTLAVLMFSMFIYRSEVTYIFLTASGKAGVVSLTGSLGCIRRTRVLANAVREAISLACAETGTRDVRYLRAEMQAHYKLAETGVITREACSDGTALILSKFG